MENYDVLVVGAGLAGATISNILSSRGKKVLIIDSRNHIGGNAYDYKENDILIHKYGPHIFHTNSSRVFEYLSQFTDWYKYEHKVLGHIKDNIVPIPFNFKSIDVCFKEKANKLKELLVKDYGENKKVPIMELLKNDDEDIKELANYIFENVFKYYTMKQWGLSIEEMDSAVSARVPVNTSYDDRYFNDEYQYLPKEGYTSLINKMLDNENIEIRLNVHSKDILVLKDNKCFVEGKEFKGDVYYTGALDELYDYKYGDLPYRSLDLVLDEKNETYQIAATENYPCPKEEKAFTRITEYKHFLENKKDGLSYIHTEYPLPFNKNGNKGNIPYYPIFTEDNQNLYSKYFEETKKYTNLHILGRLAEYKYYNMDAIVLRALEMLD